MNDAAGAGFEARLRAFYAKHNPGNEHNLSEICRKYAGKERLLCAKLFKKYGEAPDLQIKATSSIDNEPKHQESTEQEAVYDPHFKPYQLLPATKTHLDFRSPQFDALVALQSRHVQPLVPAHPFDNILKCRHLLPTSDPNYQPHKIITSKKPSSTTTAAQKPSNAAASTPTMQKKSSAVAYLEALADTYLDGPFAVLRRCFLERKRVCVVIRRVNSVRGQCAGFLKAFDKHMNLVLMDVSMWEIPLQAQEQVLHNVRQGDLSPTALRVSIANPLLHHQTHQKMNKTYSKQLFVRGDNIVMVYEETDAIVSKWRTLR